jgi:hypothetical protein
MYTEYNIILVCPPYGHNANKIPTLLQTIYIKDPEHPPPLFQYLPFDRVTQSHMGC